jgi:hypothetical protein
LASEQELKSQQNSCISLVFQCRNAIRDSDCDVSPRAVYIDANNSHPSQNVVLGFHFVDVIIFAKPSENRSSRSATSSLVCIRSYCATAKSSATQNSVPTQKKVDEIAKNATMWLQVPAKVTATKCSFLQRELGVVSCLNAIL